MEERISSAEDTIEKPDSSIKENIKFNKGLTQNIQEIQDTMKKSNIRIIGTEEEAQLKSTENIFNKIIKENFPNLKKNMPMCLWRYKKLTEHQIDWIKKKVPLPHNNQNRPRPRKTIIICTYL